MRQTRLKMQEGRKRREFRFGEEDKDLELKAKTMKGQKLTRSQDVSKEKIQDREKKMEVVGADVESLYPSLNDEVVANLVYEAILETDMKFHNINYKEGVRYLARNWSEQECRTSDLKRVLPWRANRRRGAIGTRRGEGGAMDLPTGGVDRVREEENCGKGPPNCCKNYVQNSHLQI